MKPSAVYLDHNASAPLLPEARAALVETLALTGNPSSYGKEFIRYVSSDGTIFPVTVTEAVAIGDTA